MPNSDSARPLATWLAISDSVSTPKTSDRAAPAAMPAATPSHGDFVVAATTNDATAPTSIMPSTPRFSTPDFSVTSSPSAAYTSGVPAASVSTTSCASVSIRPRAGRAAGAPDAQPVIDEDVRGEQEEEQRPLEQSSDGRRQRQVDLRRFAAEIQERHEEAREHDSQWVQPADEGDDDRGEAVTGRHRRQQLPDRTRNFADAGEPRASAADQHAQPHGAARRNSRVVGGGGGKSGDAHLVAGQALAHEDPARGDDRKRKQQRDVEPRSGEQHRRAARHRRTSSTAES